ncbi:MAG: NAD(P)H-hydrate epimerase [Planctomycetes bacterium]|nr:NAD(P)H-hydrate epimerase [Planctomycetota bacterium]
MSKSWSLARIRAVDRIAMEEFAMPGLMLMENAGRGAADWILAHAPGQVRAVILCGTGNNGGDGLVIARHLHAAHVAVEVWMIGDASRMTPDTRSNYAIVSNTRIPCRWIPLDAAIPTDAGATTIVSDIAQADLIIDALLGTGSSGPPRGAMAMAIRVANESAARRFAIDIPSGLDGRTGVAYAPTFRAEATLTFVAAKNGFDSPNALPYVGRVIVLPIGVPPEVIERTEAIDETCEVPE